MFLQLIIISIFIILFFGYMVYMPGKSFDGELPGLGMAEMETARRLESHVAMLCRNPEGRNFIEKKGLDMARKYITEEFQSYGYEVNTYEYSISDDVYANIEVQINGTSIPSEIIVVGAHYDAVVGVPGANDNGTGVAAILELANRYRDKNFPRTIRFVAFVNEEPPNFMTNTMGSYIYAKNVSMNQDNITAMFSLETIGYFNDDKDSQHYPPLFNLFYPNQGNFIAFVGNLGSRPLVTNSLKLFRKHASFPSEGIAAPSFIPGINWSDHWSFWKQGYPAIMITDTAPYRYPYYHSPEDTPEKVNYEKMVYVVNGIEKVLSELLTK